MRQRRSREGSLEEVGAVGGEEGAVPDDRYRFRRRIMSVLVGGTFATGITAVGPCVSPRIQRVNGSNKNKKLNKKVKKKKKQSSSNSPVYKSGRQRERERERSSSREYLSMWCSCQRMSVWVQLRVLGVYCGCQGESINHQSVIASQGPKNSNPTSSI